MRSRKWQSAVFVAFAISGNLWLLASNAEAQGPMGGGGGGPAAPAFNEPKFRDRMWEQGGPRLSGLHNGKLIKRVDIEGNQTISDHKILSLIQSRPDRVYDAKRFQLDLHDLYRSAFIRRVVPEIAEYEDGVVIRLTIEEQPLVREVIFHGARRLDRKMLSKHSGIEVGDPVNPFSVEMAKQRLLDLYHEKGMNQAAIQVKEGSKAGDRRVFFEIAEGPVERIWDIDFVGNQLFSDAVLKTKIESKEARAGGLMAYVGNVASKIKIEDDVRALVSAYRAIGYMQARVDYKIDYYSGGDFIKVTFVVDEGQQFIIRNIAIQGNEYPVFTDELLLDAMELKAGEPFNVAKLNRDQLHLRNEFYGRIGFVFVDIQPQPVWLDEPGMLDIVYKISEGKQYRVGDINVHIQGDSGHTKHSVVLSLLGLKEGELIDLRKIEASKARLMRSQIFETNPALGDPPDIRIRGEDYQEPSTFR